MRNAVVGHKVLTLSGSAPQLTVSPDGKFALALVFGAKPTFSSQAIVVVVNIHSARRVRLFSCGAGHHHVC